MTAFHGNPTEEKKNSQEYRMYYKFCPKAIVNQIELEFRLKSIDSFIVSGCFRQGFFSSSRNQILQGIVLER